MNILDCDNDINLLRSIIDFDNVIGRYKHETKYYSLKPELFESISGIEDCFIEFSKLRWKLHGMNKGSADPTKKIPCLDGRIVGRKIFDLISDKINVKISEPKITCSIGSSYVYFTAKSKKRGEGDYITFDARFV